MTERSIKVFGTELEDTDTLTGFIFMVFILLLLVLALFYFGACAVLYAVNALFGFPVFSWLNAFYMMILILAAYFILSGATSH